MRNAQWLCIKVGSSFLWAMYFNQSNCMSTGGSWSRFSGSLNYVTTIKKAHQWRIRLNSAINWLIFKYFILWSLLSFLTWLWSLVYPRSLHYVKFPPRCSWPTSSDDQSSMHMLEVMKGWKILGNWLKKNEYDKIKSICITLNCTLLFPVISCFGEFFFSKKIK